MSAGAGRKRPRFRSAYAEAGLSAREAVFGSRSRRNDAGGFVGRLRAKIYLGRWD